MNFIFYNSSCSCDITGFIPATIPNYSMCLNNGITQVSSVPAIYTEYEQFGKGNCTGGHTYTMSLKDGSSSAGFIQVSPAGTITIKTWNTTLTGANYTVTLKAALTNYISQYTLIDFNVLVVSLTTDPAFVTNYQQPYGQDSLVIVPSCLV
jgi:FlaG/FlaF family flagellin (archaellin)